MTRTSGPLGLRFGSKISSTEPCSSFFSGRFWCYDRINIDPLSESMSQTERWWTRSSEMRMWSWEDSAISGMILGEICLEILGKLRKIHWVIRFFPPLFMAFLWYLNIDYGYPGIPWYPPCSDTPMLQKVKPQCRYVDMVENARDQVGYSWASRWLRLWSSMLVIHYHHQNNDN